MTDIKTLQERFKKFKEKKILIYGTGKTAARLIEALWDFHIVGVLDRVRFEGMFSGRPILTWDDIDTETADLIILGAVKKNYKTIFDRIQYDCIALDIEIYGENGRNLTKDYQMKYMDNAQIEYFEKNEKQLKSQIDCYDAVSFDLFDTLIMRKTLEPADVFDLVENRIRNKGIIIPEFKKKRKTAEHQLSNPNIYQIYENFSKITGMNKEDTMIVMQEEIECEKQCLIPRIVMAQIMEYAIRKGKKVSIISDMYLPASIIESILQDMGIKGYEKLYISCDYGRGKGSGIFQTYLQDMGNVKCLHIGDHYNADVLAPKKYGIDSYEIKSALELLKISSLRRLLICSRGISNRVALGLILSELFNDPFMLCHTGGFVPVKRQDLLARLFVAPAALVYMQNLAGILQSGDYEAILFSARDGYLFKKIYDAYFLQEYHVPAIYFLISRKLSLTATLDSEQDILELCRWFPSERSLKQFINELLNEKDFFSDDKNFTDREEYLLSIGEKLKQYSSAMQKNYKKYTDKLHIDWNKRYLFCDLNSGGTAHSALCRIFSRYLEGFYFCRRQGGRGEGLQVISVYDERKGQSFSHAIGLLETILTAPTPSVRAIDETGNPVYGKEKRGRREMEFVETAQEAVMEYVRQYIRLRGIDGRIDSELPEIALGLLDCVKYEDETGFLIETEHIDDLSQTGTSVLGR